MNENGRPLKFETPEILQQKIDEYFKYCDEYEKPYTITGLAVFLDTSRQTLLNYEEKDDFFDTIKRAKSKVEAYAEEKLFRTSQVAGVIFNLKNNFKWRDAQDINIGTKKLEDFIDAFDDIDE